MGGSRSRSRSPGRHHKEGRSKSQERERRERQSRTRSRSSSRSRQANRGDHSERERDRRVSPVDPLRVPSTLQARESRGMPQQRGHNTATGDFAGSIRPLSILNPVYQQEGARLATFEHWPETACVSPEELAQAGFVYLGSGDRVQCTFCKGILRNWEPGERAFQEHQRHFPQCSFVRNRSAANTTPTSRSAFTTHTSVQDIDPRAVTASMKTDVVTEAIGMGFAPSLVRQVVEFRLRTQDMW